MFCELWNFPWKCDVTTAVKIFDLHLKVPAIPYSNQINYCFFFSSFQRLFSIKQKLLSWYLSGDKGTYVVKFHLRDDLIILCQKCAFSDWQILKKSCDYHCLSKAADDLSGLLSSVNLYVVLLLKSSELKIEATSYPCGVRYARQLSFYIFILLVLFLLVFCNIYYFFPHFPTFLYGSPL